MSVGAFLALAGAGNAAIPMPAPDPDAELLRLVAHYSAASVEADRLYRLYEAGGRRDAALFARVERADDEEYALLHQLMETEARTLAGVLAKARISAKTWGGSLPSTGDGPSPLYNHHIVRDLAALARGIG